MKTPTTVAIVLTLLAIVSAAGRTQSVARPAVSAPTPLATLATALSGQWQLQVRFEPVSATGNKAIEGSGEESWSLGPGGIDLIEQEHIPSPDGETFLMGVIWWDGTKKQLAGMECNSQLPFTCDLKGALNDITMTWDGKRFEIDEIESHNGKRTVWHEYWTDITPTSFVQSGDVTQPDGTTVRFMNIRGTRVKKLERLHGI
jgi:hypothetical protein